MSDLDLAEAIEAACQRAEIVDKGHEVAAGVAAAAPLIERQVRERIAADIETDARIADTVQNVPRRNALRHAARIARGES